MDKWFLALCALCAIGSSVIGSRICTYEEIHRRSKTCATNAGYQSFVDGTGGNNIKKSCRDGRLQTYSDCMKGMANNCGIASLFDFEKTRDLAGKLCHDAPALTPAARCITENEDSLRSCVTSNMAGWRQYVRSESISSEPAVVICHAIGARKKCLRDTFEPCGQPASDVLILMVDAFSPTACHGVDSCEVCGAGKTIKMSGFLIGVVLLFKQVVM